MRENRNFIASCEALLPHDALSDSHHSGVEEDNIGALPARQRHERFVLRAGKRDDLVRLNKITQVTDPAPQGPALAQPPFDPFFLIEV